MEAADQAQALCRSCGLCCDGTLFSRAALAPDEPVHPALAATVSWIGSKRKHLLAQPCAAFDGSCAVYQSRPSVCANYKCALLRCADAGLTDWAAAHAVVATARGQRERLRAALRQVLGDDIDASSLSALMGRLRATRGAHEPAAAFRARHASIFVGHAALRLYLARHFRRAKAQSAPLHHYRAHGLHFASEIELPELERAPAHASPVFIRYGRIPDGLANAAIRQESHEIGHDGYLSRVKGVARFWVRAGSNVVVARAPGAVDEDIRTFLLSSIMGALCHQNGLLPLHGSAVAVDGAAVVLLGMSGRGKSTLAAACHVRGFPIITDDLTAISMDGGRPVVHAGVASVKLRPDVIQLLGLTGRAHALRMQTGKYRVGVPPAPSQTPLPIRAIFVLRDFRAGAPHVELERVPRADCVRVLGRQTYRRRLVNPLGRDAGHFDIAAAVARETPLFRLHRPEGLSRLGDVVDALAHSDWGASLSSPGTR